MWYVKEDVVQRKKRSTSKRRTMIKMHKCHEKHWRHNLLSLGTAAKFSGEIIQAELTRWRLEKRDFHTEEAEYAKSPNMGQWDTILNFHVKLGKQLSLSLDSSLVTIPKFSNCWFKLLFLGLLYIYFLKTRILKSISNNLNDMTKLITTPCFLVNTVRIPIILKLIVLLADTYIQAYPYLSCCLCLHLQMGRQGAWFHSKLCFLAHTAQTNGNNI